MMSLRLLTSQQLPNENLSRHFADRLALRVRKRNSAVASREDFTRGRADRAPAVHPKRGEITRQITLPATILPNQQATLFAKVPATCKKSPSIKATR